MVKLDRIYTGGGDRGETHLGDGSRAPKTDPRVAVLGTVDELNAIIGLARLQVAEPAPGKLLADLQNALFDLGADFARPLPDDPQAPPPLRITEAQVAALEEQIDHYNAELTPLTSFVLPGGTTAAAHLHHARTVARRAEREAWALAEAAELNQAAQRYLNRLSDLFFVLARWCNARGEADVLWQPGKNR